MSKISIINTSRHPAAPLEVISPPEPVQSLALRARVCMAERGIRSVSGLQRKLAEIGVAISVSQLGRVIDNKADHLSVPVLNGLLRVFNCQVMDLFEDVRTTH